MTHPLFNTRRNQFIPMIATLICILPVLGSCGSKTADALPPLPETGAEAVLGKFDTTTLQDEAVVNDALEKALTSCMQSAGFDYTSPEIPVAIEVDRHGHLIRDIVKVYGYGLPPEYHTSAPDFYDGNRSADFLEAINGNGEGGCLLRAADSVYGNYEMYARLSSDLTEVEGKSIMAALNDPRYQSALESWASCVKDAGYSVASFGELIEMVSDPNQKPGEPASEGEVKAALADLDCRESTQVNETLRQVDWAYQAEIVGPDRSTVDAYEQLWTQSVGRAADLLANG
jgi:hypothetical protein